MEPSNVALNISGGDHAGTIIGENTGTFLICNFNATPKDQHTNNSQYKLTPSAIDTLRETFPEDVQMYGRYDNMMRLKSLFKRPGPVSRIVLTGPKGVGKTLLAVTFAREIQREHDILFMFFIKAGNVSDFEEALNDIAIQLNLQDAKTASHETHKKALERWLSNPERGKWVMIVDNVHDSLTFKSFPPRVDHGFSMFTRRTQCVGHSLDRETTVIVKALPEQSCRHLLRCQLGDLDCREPENVAALISYSAGIPSELMQAVDWIRGHGSLADYLTSCGYRTGKEEETNTDAIIDR